MCARCVLLPTCGAAPSIATTGVSSTTVCEAPTSRSAAPLSQPLDWRFVVTGSTRPGYLGGWLTTSFSWRWVFGINLPIAALLAVGTRMWVPQTRGEEAARRGFDGGGLALSAIGMGGVVLGLIEGRSLGWWAPLASGWAHDWPVSPAGLGLVLGGVTLVAFVVLELRRLAAGAEVLLDMSLFRLPSFAWGNVAALVVAMGEFGLLFVLPLYLINALGLDVMGAGLVLAAMAAGAFLSGAAARHLAAWPRRS